MLYSLECLLHSSAVAAVAGYHDGGQQLRSHEIRHNEEQYTCINNEFRNVLGEMVPEPPCSAPITLFNVFWGLSVFSLSSSICTLAYSYRYKEVTPFLA